jgi:hypothetical protein
LSWIRRKSLQSVLKYYLTFIQREYEKSRKYHWEWLALIIDNPVNVKCIRVELTHKGMVRSDMSKPALIFFPTVRVHTTKSTVKILAANTHWKYFFKNNKKFSEFKKKSILNKYLIQRIINILNLLSMGHLNSCLVNGLNL